MKSTHTIIIWRNAAGEFRWRALSRNGRIIASASEGFRRYGDCRKSVLRGVEDAREFDFPARWPLKTDSVRVRRRVA
jgi:uncharacterized protein YegP (UPF0339 family)